MLREYIIPSSVLFSTNLGRKEKLLFAVLYTEAQQNDGVIIKSNSELGKIIGVTSNQVTKCLKKLKDNNFIDTQYENKTKYEIPTNDNWERIMSEKPKFNIQRRITINPILKKRKRKTK